MFSNKTHHAQISDQLFILYLPRKYQSKTEKERATEAFFDVIELVLPVAGDEFEHIIFSAYCDIICSSAAAEAGRNWILKLQQLSIFFLFFLAGLLWNSAVNS